MGDFLKFLKNKKLIITISSILAVLILAFTAFGIYVGDYYHADNTAIAEFSEGWAVEAKTLSKNLLVYEAEEPIAGFIFYPGGKVEHTAYEPLMQALADRNITCVLVKMPFNLAVFDINAADGIKEKLPKIENWYIGGHSLGGSMAASHVSKRDGFKGLVLLASYSTADLSRKDIYALSLFGNLDKVLNTEKYQNNKKNLPNNLMEIELRGGNHAYFGMYGEQKGDGKAEMTNEEQILLAAEEILKFVKLSLQNANF